MADKPKNDGAPAPTPEQEVRRLYEEAESRVAKAAERVVSRDSFGELLAMVTENVVSLTRIGNEAMDMVLRNLRVAGRQDINRLTRALGRTEDKLEQVLQEVEELRNELAGAPKSNGTSGTRAAGSSESGSTGTRRRTTRRSGSS
ncbi:MAG: hypothetical protein QOH72_812 [Solirubrobacteraceae bacterium]|jgi:hypothetical protein|nr:hypothetical protein [Solirubrobacteraceae bacterium]